MSLALKDVYLDGRKMGCASTWGEVAGLLANAGHRAAAQAVGRNEFYEGIVCGESPTGFFVRRAKECAA